MNPNNTLLRKDKENEETLFTLRAVKMVSILALRNQGWGHIRLKRFSEEFNDIVVDISQGRLSLTDIPDTIYDETDLTMRDLELRGL